MSLATASRALNGSARTPSPDITERVRAAAEELGYLPNAQAQALAKDRTGLLGLIVHDISDPFFSSIASGVQQAARSYGKTVILTGTDGSPEDERRALEALAAQRPDAIVMAGSRSTAPPSMGGNIALREAVDRYLAHGGRLTVIGQSPIGNQGGRETVLSTPDEALSADLARALIAQGHRRFTVVAGPEHTVTSDLRLSGFQRGLGESGAKAAEVTRTGFNREGGLAASRELAKTVIRDREAGEPRCIFAVSDRMAMGVVAGLRGSSLEAPGDYAVAGFGDIPTLQDFHPELTTVRIPLVDIGRQGALTALGEDPGPQEPSCRLVLRASTGTSVETTPYQEGKQGLLEPGERGRAVRIRPA